MSDIKAPYLNASTIMLGPNNSGIIDSSPFPKLNGAQGQLQIPARPPEKTFASMAQATQAAANIIKNSKGATLAYPVSLSNGKAGLYTQTTQFYQLSGVEKNPNLNSKETAINYLSAKLKAAQNKGIILSTQDISPMSIGDFYSRHSR